jgi:hypothetical protein
MATAMATYFDQCTWGHDTNRGTGIGENIYASVPYSTVAATVQTHMANAFINWASEESRFSNALVANTFCTGGVCGHYSQIVWRLTTHIGCAYAGCETAVGLNATAGWTKPHLVGCRYRPAGNTATQYAYQQAEYDAASPGMLELNGQRFYHPSEYSQGHFNWSIVAVGVAVVALVAIAAVILVVRRRRAAASIEEGAVELLA